MKKYVSILLAAILGASLLAGCGGSGKSGQQPAKEAQEQAAQPEKTKTEEAGSVEDAAQADEAKDDAQADAAAAKDDPQADAAAAEDDPQTDAAASKDGLQADADTAADSDAYLVYVKDAETMAPMPGVNVQFCSDVMCQMGKTDENGVAAFHSDPGTYTVHLMKAPDGYVSSTEEFTLDQDNREATWLLEKQKTEPEPGADTDPVGSENSDSEMDFPYAGFTFTAPEEFKEVTGEIRTNDFGEIGADSGIVIGYVAYQARTEAELMEFLKTAGINPEGEVTDEQLSKVRSFYADTPELLLFRVMGVRGDQDTDELKKQMFDFPVLVFDEIGTAGDYKFYYVVLDDENYYEELRGTGYPKDKLEESYKLWQEASTTNNFKDRIKVKEPVSPYPSVEDGASVSFEALDLEGNSVTSGELLAGKKITMINIWATWCINCKKEMEKLEALNKEWADKGCQIIGICDDAEDDEMIAEAKKILEEHGVTFPNVRMTEEIREQLPTTGLPTSYFVDSEGKILGRPIIGAYEEQYDEALENLLSGME